jgi:hypothetical protein
MLRIGIAGVALLAIGAAEPGPALPGWMAGCWQQKSGDDWTEECWTAARGGTMLGSSRAGTGDTTREWEAMQIIAAGADDSVAPRMTYWASPGGKDRTAFAWVESSAPGISFVNTAHDYPQRIRYWREGELLMAEISLADGSKPMRWRYVRM